MLSQTRARILRDFQKQHKWARVLRLRQLHQVLKTHPSPNYRRYAGENWLYREPRRQIMVRFDDVTLQRAR